jgi:hypothetical protein
VTKRRAGSAPPSGRDDNGSTHEAAGIDDAAGAEAVREDKTASVGSDGRARVTAASRQRRGRA